MKLLNSLAFACSFVNGNYWQPWFKNEGYNHGDYIECRPADSADHDFDFITATCSSGRKRHCQSSLGSDTSHSIKCQEKDLIFIIDDYHPDYHKPCRTIQGSFG